MQRNLPRIAASLGAAFFFVNGVWAFLAPRSFFDTVATYPPYNEHLFHDLGSFALGVGVALAAGLLRTSGLVAGLAGGAVATTLHAISHWIDRDQGGRSSDAPLLSVLAVVVVAGVLMAARRRGEDATP